MLIIKNGKIVTMDNRLIDGGDILVDNGKICDILETSSYIPTSCDIVIDAYEKFVFPGFIDIHTHCGLDGTHIGDIYNPDIFIAPQTPTVKYINSANEAFDNCVKSGITSVVVAPFDEKIVGGKCCMVKTASKNTNEINTVSDFCCEKLSLCSMNNENVKIEPANVPHFIRNELKSALSYISPAKVELPLMKSPTLESYRPILCDNMPAFISVSNDEQLKIALNIIGSFSLNGVIVLCDFDAAETTFSLLKQKMTPFIFNPLSVGTGARKRFVTALEDADIKFAVSTSHPAINSDILPLNAGILVRDGMDMESVLDSITTTPAKLCNVDYKIGSLSKGKDADIVIFDGNPLEVMSSVLFTVIDGSIVYSAG